MTLFPAQDRNASGFGSIYIWGAQLVEGSNALDYQRTETRLNIPRLDYSLGSCPSLLVEPQRTNLALSSEDLTNATYWNNSNTTDTANQAISPDGTQDADRVNADAVNTFHRIYGQASISASTSYTYSVYAKANTLGFIQLALNNGFVVNYLLSPYANFNLTTGTVSQSGNGATAKIQSLGNAWYRCSITSTSLVGALAGEYNINLINAGTLTPFQSWAGTTNDSVFLWGAQLEAGAYATSYIPTTSASVTRNADVISKTGISSLIGQTEGTLFYEGSKIGLDTSEFYLSDGTYDNHIRLQYFSNTNIIFGVLVVGGAAQCVLSTSAFTVSDNLKIAFKYKANDFALWINGTEVATDTSGTTFAANTLNRINLGQPDNSASGVFKGNVKALSLWKTALTNAQLAQLTTI
jgi:hypothetical protein